MTLDLNLFWVNVKRISKLKLLYSHKLNAWVFFHTLTHSLQPHQMFDHTKLMGMYNKPHSLTYTHSLTTPNCGVSFLSLTTHSLQPHQTFDHTKLMYILCTTNLTYWLTHSLQPQQIVTTPNYVYNKQKYTVTTPTDTLSTTTPNVWPHQIVYILCTTNLTHWLTHSL